MKPTSAISEQLATATQVAGARLTAALASRLRWN